MNIYQCLFDIQFELTKLYPALNILRLRDEPFHNLIRLYIRTLDRIYRDNKKEKQNNMNNFKGKFSNQKQQPVDKRNDPEWCKKTYGTITLPDGRVLPKRPAL